MITQYSHQQITLSDREKEYAWFHYAAQIINAGCMDQSLSGYSITGTGSDGKTVSAELTNEELFQIFSEVTTKYGKELIKARMQEESQMEQSMLQEDVQPDPLERKDFQIQIVRHELKTRKADVSIAWGNNIKVEGISINSRSRGGVRLVQPTLFGTDGQRTQLIHVGDALQNAILDAYNKMPDEQEMLRTVYIAKQTGFFVRTIPVQEGKVMGYADIQIGNELRIDKVRIRNNEGKKSVMYPSESIGSGVNRKWHNLASELPDSRLHEKILQVFEEEQRKHQRQTGRSHSHRSEREPEEEEEWER